jgi:hypothetical protein
MSGDDTGPMPPQDQGLPVQRLILPLTVLAAAARIGAVSVPICAAPQWASVSSAAIHPGVQLFTDGAQCTANFVFTSGDHVYLGQAAHCSAAEDADGGDGCTSPSLPLGTPVTVQGATRPARVVYSSWLTMQAARESDPASCRYNDFELVELDPSDVGSVNPTVPIWGGPIGLATTGTLEGQPIYGYGHSELTVSQPDLGPKQGVSLGDRGGGWSHAVLTATPGIPGDSGSAYLDSEGRALGVLSTLDLVPVPGSNGIGDLSRELQYLHTHTHTTFGSLQLALGTQPFATRTVPSSGQGRPWVQ